MCVSMRAPSSRGGGGGGGRPTRRVLIFTLAARATLSLLCKLNSHCSHSQQWTRACPADSSTESSLLSDAGARVICRVVWLTNSVAAHNLWALSSAVCLDFGSSRGSRGRTLQIKLTSGPRRYSLLCHSTSGRRSFSWSRAAVATLARDANTPPRHLQSAKLIPVTLAAPSESVWESEIASHLR